MHLKNSHTGLGSQKSKLTALELVKEGATTLCPPPPYQTRVKGWIIHFNSDPFRVQKYCNPLSWSHFWQFILILIPLSYSFQQYCQAPGPAQGQVQGQVRSRARSMSRFMFTTNSKLKFQSHNLKSRDLERHYNQMSHPPPPTTKLFQTNIKEILTIYHITTMSQHCHNTVTSLSQHCHKTVTKLSQYC